MVPCDKCREISRFSLRYLVPLWLVLSVFFLFSYYHQSSKKQEFKLALSTPQITRNWSRSRKTVSSTAEVFENARKEKRLIGAIRKNPGKTSGSAVCVVDPAMTECEGSGFSAFLLFTLDQIVACRALGINQITVFWRDSNSVCSWDPKVNSWNWYFEPVNEGLESKVEHVFCPLALTDDTEVLKRLNKTGKADVTSILDNSFKARTDVEGYEDSRIITKQERVRVNELIGQYVRPNSRIREKVRMFHRRYLEGFTVLGVQVRGTDHWMETSEQRLPSMMSWIKRAHEILETLPQPRKIFIASDNNEVIQKFVSVFGKEMVSLNLFVFSQSHRIILN